MHGWTIIFASMLVFGLFFRNARRVHRYETCQIFLISLLVLTLFTFWLHKWFSDWEALAGQAACHTSQITVQFISNSNCPSQVGPQSLWTQTLLWNLVVHWYQKVSLITQYESASQMYFIQ